MRGVVRARKLVRQDLTQTGELRVRRVHAGRIREAAGPLSAMG